MKQMLFKKLKRSAAGKQVIGLIWGLAFLMAMLSGCGKQTPLSSDYQQEAQPKEAAQARVEDSIKLALQYVRENPVSGSMVSYPYDQNDLAYSALDKEQKKLYDEMLPKVQKLVSFEYTAKEHGYEVLDNVLIAAAALCKDHPECEIYFDISEVLDGDTTTALRALYYFPNDPNAAPVTDTAAVKNEVQIFEEECNLIVAAIPQDFSTYDRYRYLATVISIRTGYDYTFTGGKQLANAYGAIEGGLSICQGYSTGFAYLCRKANLWCKLVSGNSRNESHAWNLVKLESGTYHVDVTWADADQNIPLDAGWQSYFMLTQEEILTDHEIDDGTVATGTPLSESSEGKGDTFAKSNQGLTLF